MKKKSAAVSLREVEQTEPIPHRSPMYAHILFQDCAFLNHTTCNEATCDKNIIASEYWEEKRLQDIKDRALEAAMAKFPVSAN